MRLTGVCVDSSNLFVCGEIDEGAGAQTPYIAKLALDTLAIVADTYLDSSTGGYSAHDICEDGNFIYVVAAGEGSTVTGLAIFKIAKSDLSISVQKVYETSTVSFPSIATNGTYVYIASSTTAEADSGLAPLILEYTVSDLTLNAKYYLAESGGSAPQGRFFGVYCDASNVYAVGYKAATTGLVVKLDVNGLGNVVQKYVGLGGFYDVAGDTDNLYVVGDATAATTPAVLLKMLKSDLSVSISYKLTPSTGGHTLRFRGIDINGTTLAISGWHLDGATTSTGIVVHLDTANIAQLTKHIELAHASECDFYGIAINSSNIYCVDIEQAAIFKFGTALSGAGTGSGWTVTEPGYAWASESFAVSSGGFVVTTAAKTAENAAHTATSSSATQGSVGTAPATNTYTTASRILSVIQTETPFEDIVEVILDNQDQAFKDLDLRGQKVTLGFGFDSNYSDVPDLRVVRQEDISVYGRLFTRLACIGNWNKLAMHKVMGDTATGALTTGSDTVKQIIEARILTDMTLVVDTSDGEEDNKVPNSQYEVYTDRRTVIQENVGLTENLLFMRASDMHMIKKNSSQQHQITGTISGTFAKGETITQASTGATGKFVYQMATYIVIEAETGVFTVSANQLTAPSGATLSNPSAIAAFDYLYGPLAGDHTFYAFTRTQSLLTANRVIAVDTLPDTSGTTHTYPSDASFYANDTDDQAVFGLSTLIFEDPSISSDAEALTVATSRLEHIKTESIGGILLAPMNCGQEMYDYVQIDDDRAGFTSGSKQSQRVSRIVRRFSPGEYTIELGFGGLVWDTPENYDLSHIATDADDIEKAVSRIPEGAIPIDRRPRMPNEEERLAQVAADSARVIADMSREQQQQFLKDVKAGMEALGISTEGVGKPVPITPIKAQPIDKTVAEIGKGLADMTPEQKKKFMENIRRQLNEEN